MKIDASSAGSKHTAETLALIARKTIKGLISKRKEKTKKEF